MYKAFFEFNESNSTHIYKNFISKITNDEDVFSPNLSIENNNDIPGFKKIVIQLDILEDFTYELKSNFQSYKDALGEVSTLAGSILGFFDKLNTASALNQRTSSAAELMKVQVWKETEPFRMNFKFSLQTKTNPFIDVYLPAILLSSQTILSPIENNQGGQGTTTNTQGQKVLTNLQFKTPGVNQQKLTSMGNTKKPSERNASSKILDTFAILVRNVQLFSPTQTTSSTTNKKYSDTEYRSDDSILSNYNPLISLDYAFIETAKPTWSKERTESGVPLWCELELTVQSVFSANDSMFSYLYPEPDDEFLSLQTGGRILNAGITKAVNIFR